MLSKKHTIFKESLIKVVLEIFNNPNKVFHLRLLAKKTKLSTTAIKKTILELEKLNIIKIQKTDLTTNISANLESEEYRFYKTLVNRYQIKDLTDYLVKSFNFPETIVLFGSYARGEDTEKSDIDILVITQNKESLMELKELENKLNRKINIHILKSIKNSKEEFKNSIANGIVLYGHLEEIK